MIHTNNNNCNKTIIIFICLFLINLINGQNLGNQKQSALCIVDTVIPNSNNDGYLCMSGVLLCDGSQTTVLEINLNGNIFHDINCDFSVFVDATSIFLNGNSHVIPNIFTRLPQFVNVAQISIENFVDEVPETIVLPNNLKYVNIANAISPIPNAFFSTGAIEVLVVERSLHDLPSGYINNNLKSLYFPISSISNIPSNLHQSLLGLTNLDLTILNEVTPTFQQFNFPPIAKFQSLKNLNIYFTTSPSMFNFNFNQSITSSNLNSLFIYGNGFTGTDQLDFTNFDTGSILTFKASNDIDYLNFAKFPVGTELSFSSISVDLTNFNFEDVVILKVADNKFGPQELVTNFNYEKMVSLELVSNGLTGSIPNEYCKFKAGVLKLSENQLSGTVPACFGCMGGNYPPFDTLFPNDFINFNSTSPPLLCSEFGISVEFDKTIPLKTNVTTLIKVVGNDMGYTIDYQSTQSNITCEFTIPNYELLVTIPPGAGINHTITIGLGITPLSNQFTIEYSFEKPVISGFATVGNNDSTLFLLGSGFSYNTDYNNTVTINDIVFKGNLQIVEGTQLITFSNDNNPISVLPFKSLMQFNVSIDVNGQISDKVTFYYFAGVVAGGVENYKLNSSGSNDYLITISGEFGVPSSNYSLFIVKIDNVKVNLLSVNGSSIVVIGYPPASVGLHSISFQGSEGKPFTTNIEYVQTPTLAPTTSSDDEPSISSNLSISLLLSIFIVILSIITI